MDSDSSDHFHEDVPFDDYEPNGDINEKGKRKRSSKERLIQLAVVLFIILMIVALWKLK